MCKIFSNKNRYKYKFYIYYLFLLKTGFIIWMKTIFKGIIQPKTSNKQKQIFCAIN